MNFSQYHRFNRWETQPRFLKLQFWFCSKHLKSQNARIIKHERKNKVGVNFQNTSRWILAGLNLPKVIIGNNRASFGFWSKFVKKGTRITSNLLHLWTCNGLVITSMYKIFSNSTNIFCDGPKGSSMIFFH